MIPLATANGTHNNISAANQETSNELPEPLLEENPNRFVMFPIKYNDIWKMYKDQKAAFWTAEEIDLAQDVKDWERLSKNE